MLSPPRDAGDLIQFLLIETGNERGTDMQAAQRMSRDYFSRLT
jgi:hypothetical protein